MHYETPAGAYAGVAAWRSREHWLAWVVPVAIAAHPELRAGLVSEDLLRRYLVVRSGYAHRRTGRGATVRPDTLASVLGVTKRQVQNCARVSRAIGLEVVIQRGRMLTWAERMEAWRSGSHQRGLATEVAFTTPSGLGKTPGEIFTPPRRTKSSSKTHLTPPSPDAARGEKKDAAPPRPPRRGAARRRAGTQLGAELVKIVPWLRQEAPRRLGPALARFATAPTPWSPQDVVLALADLAKRRGQIAPLTADRIATRPAVVLAGLLRHLDVEADHPSHTPFVDPATLKPCRRTDCDGHGWVTISDGRGRHVVAKCPDCPPGIRANVVDDGLDEEPPF
ncbi:hypothetical protein [Marihabitans asiaticum]|uniref:Uncharacterized protein n=1 Tax=Marihabitans asiaticum TaxID=415218 RepID=A0A560W5Y6_9MICO|nr:hypothetical protein [Marihabitans asiaticum]TWD13043.1 hypothetical protein FB557_2810 [Marihabitans asiaticum]